MYKVKDILTGFYRAIKLIPISSDDQFKKVSEEIGNLINVDSPYVVKIIEYFLNKPFVYIVMEYLEGPTLSDYINSKH